MACNGDTSCGTERDGFLGRMVVRCRACVFAEARGGKVVFAVWVRHGLLFGQPLCLWMVYSAAKPAEEASVWTG